MTKLCMKIPTTATSEMPKRNANPCEGSTVPGAAVVSILDGLLTRFPIIHDANQIIEREDD